MWLYCSGAGENPLRVRAELEMLSPNRDNGEEEEEDGVVHFEV